MKCLVFSDSHGSTYFMRRAIEMNKDAEVIFFLGDGLSDADALACFDSSRAWVVVRGNCDLTSVFRGSEVKKVESITLEGFKIVLTHGDLYRAKYGTEGLKCLALEHEADVVLFGHTHVPYEKYVGDADKPYYLFNPGSISGASRSFGILTIDKSVLLSHGNFI